MLRTPHVLQIKDLGVKAGVVLNPGTSLTVIEEVGLHPLLLFLHSCASCLVCLVIFIELFYDALQEPLQVTTPHPV